LRYASTTAAVASFTPSLAGLQEGVATLASDQENCGKPNQRAPRFVGMNVQSLHTLLVEEIRGLVAGNERSLDALRAQPFSPLVAAVREMMDRYISDGVAQNALLKGILDRLGKPVTGGRCDAVQGILRELDEVNVRDSGVDPANLDPRILVVLRKLIYHRLACFRSILEAAHVLTAGGIEEVALTGLKQELAAERSLGDQSAAILRFSFAQTGEEVAKAVNSVVQ
jgi:ferritin-like metal-binding protein YciE